ncbi:MAG: glycosyltransferase family 39 protein [Caldilineaceae bacterium]|nr:glycosyltransferase family 39 protein [Caldilineaceae bacterium]
MPKSPADILLIQHPRRWLTVIVAVYLIVATLFALYTPPWQNPDEPAHYNYIAHIAAGHGLPVLQMGDYDQALRDELTTLHFPPERSIAALRYENYQPPLYYVTAAPVFWLAQQLGSAQPLIWLRLYDVLLGACSLLLLYACLDAAFPQTPSIALAATAFSALLPMHIAMNAAVNNDGLAELLLLAAMLTLLRWMAARFNGDAANPRLLLLLGVLLGLGLLTKIYAYALLPVCLLGVLMTEWRLALGDLGRKIGAAVQPLVTVLIPAVLIGIPLWLRNALNYGWRDPLGLNWHDQVVVGQVTTAQWLAQNGWPAYWQRAWDFTFKSFWGVFGWLGLFVDGRIYTALLLFSTVLMVGTLWIVGRTSLRWGKLSAMRQQVALLFGLMLLAVLASYALYNLKFVQHQGRYLFWGLLPISALMAAGWRAMTRWPPALAAMLVVGGLSVWLALGDNMNKWTLLSGGLIGMLILLQPLLFSGWSNGIVQRAAPTLAQSAFLPFLRAAAWCAPFLLLIVLNLVCLFWFIVPML